MLQILLYILNEHDEYFQVVYSLLGNSMILILSICQTLFIALMKTEKIFDGIDGEITCTEICFIVNIINQCSCCHFWIM